MKAQFWSIDVIFGIVIFLTALILLVSTWDSISQQFSLAYGYGTGNMQAQLQSLQQRILFQGYPSNWNLVVNLSNVNTWANVSIGLGTGNNGTLSTSKTLELMAMSGGNYQDTKSLLGVGYEYYIVISSPYFNNATIGLNPARFNATSVQVANRQVVMDNGDPANVRMMIWTNKSYGVS